MDDRKNTIAGWVLFAGIIALGGAIVTGEYFHAERPEKMGFPIAGVSDQPEGGETAEQPIAFYLASAKPELGAQVFKRCATCHTDSKGGPNGVGPNLYGVVGGPVGAHAPGFAYTADLKALGGTWDWDKLNKWLQNPKALVPGTKMSFAGLSKPEDRANVIAYLNSTSDSPLPMPAVPAAGASPAEAAAEKADEGAAGGKAADQPVLNEAQAAAAPGKSVAGDAAPAVSGRAEQTKTGH
jgi:cytochrome c